MYYRVQEKHRKYIRANKACQGISRKNGKQKLPTKKPEYRVLIAA